MPATARCTARLVMRRLSALGAIAGVAALVAACGGGGSPSSPASAAASSAAATAVPTFTATEFAFSPSTAAAKAGRVKLTLANDGKVVHELIVLKTGQAADAPKVTDGRVSEAASVGEVSETAAGATRSVTLALVAGRYLYVCKIPGHYADGMRGMLTVR